MTEVSNNVKQLFAAGLTRDEFINQYKEIQANTQENNLPIFANQLNENIIGAMYDSFHMEGSDVTTEEDIKRLASYDGDKSSISNEDITRLYEQTLQKLTRVDNNGELSINDINSTIELLNQLKEIKQNIAKDKKNIIRAEIDKLIDENKNKNNKLLQEYKTIQNNIKNAEEQAREKEYKINNINKDIISINQAIADKQNSLSEDTDNKDTLNQELKTLSNKSSLYSENFVKLQNELSSINKTIPNFKSKLKQIINTIESTDKKLGQSIKQREEKIDEIDKNLKEELDKIDEQIRNYEDEFIYDDATINANNDFINANGYKTGCRYNGVKGSFDASNVDFNKNNNAISFNSFSNKGLKYSSEKGQKLARDVANNSVGFTGHCSRYVRSSLQRTGLYNGHTASAYQMGAVLANNSNFQEISVNDVDLKNLPAGCILVYNHGAAGYSSIHGHIEVTLGDGTACSDGRTHNLRRTQNMRIFVPVENS